jgi:hypothetical protein
MTIYTTAAAFALASQTANIAKPRLKRAIKQNKMAKALFLCTSLASTSLFANVAVDIGTDSQNNGVWLLSEAATFSTASQDGWVTSSSGNYLVTAGSGFFTGSLTFDASDPIANSGSIQINSFGVDDRAEILLNGKLIDAVGIFGGGAGYFQSTANGSFVSTTFNADNSGLTLSGLTLLNGVNTVEIIVNNTGNGISPNYNTIPTRSDPADVALVGNIQYAVPEPGTIALLVSGLLGLGAWRKKSASNCM